MRRDVLRTHRLSSVLLCCQNHVFGLRICSLNATRLWTRFCDKIGLPSILKQNKLTFHAGCDSAWLCPSFPRLISFSDSAIRTSEPYIRGQADINYTLAMQYIQRGTHLCSERIRESNGRVRSDHTHTVIEDFFAGCRILLLSGLSRVCLAIYHAARTIGKDIFIAHQSSLSSSIHPYCRCFVCCPISVGISVVVNQFGSLSPTHWS